MLQPIDMSVHHSAAGIAPNCSHGIPIATPRYTSFSLALTRHLHLGVKAKVENKGQYDQYLNELKSLREELGVPLKEDLYPEGN